MMALIVSINRHLSAELDIHERSIGSYDLYKQVEVWLAEGGWKRARRELARRGYHGIVADIEHY